MNERPKNFGITEKISGAFDEAREQKQQASREPGTLKPTGKPGAIVRDLQNSFEQLGLRADDPENVRKLRESYERRLRDKVQEIYTVYGETAVKMPSREQFAKLTEAAFLHGFDLYLKVAVQLDIKKSPDPHKPAFMNMYGRDGKVKVTDDLDKEDHTRAFIAQGSNVDLDPSFDYNFDKNQEVEGYADKYQPLEGRTDEEAALEAYMFEKFRIYEQEFTAMLEESLKRGIPARSAIELAQFVYGNDASIYEEMEEQGIDAKLVAWQSNVNRTRVRVPLEKYLEVGGELEEKYPYVAGSGWVTSPVMIRNLVFKFPQTVEAGLQVVEHELGDLKQQFPQMPQRIIMNVCAGAPDTYEAELRHRMQAAELLMAEFPMDEEFGGEKGSDNVFQHYQLEGRVLELIDRVGVKKQKATLYDVLGRFRQALETAEETGLDLNFSAKRRVLRSLLTYNAAADRVLRRERNVQNRRNEALLTKAEKIDPVWGGYFVDFGVGETDESLIEHGKIIVDLYRGQFGDDGAEEYLDELFNMYHKYIDSGFPKDPEKLDKLKDALTMEPFNTREFFEKINGPWPEGVEEVMASIDQDA